MALRIKESNMNDKWQTGTLFTKLIKSRELLKNNHKYVYMTWEIPNLYWYEILKWIYKLWWCGWDGRLLNIIAWSLISIKQFLSRKKTNRKWQICVMKDELWFINHHSIWSEWNSEQTNHDYRWNMEGFHGLINTDFSAMRGL